jgi:pimeloyl-ACP methyl ester carboxylesterase
VYAVEFGWRIAGARVEVLENAGHFPQVEQPGPALQLIADFLA